MLRLQNSSDWERLLESSRTKPAVVFKHSTICDISSHALRSFRDFSTEHESVSCAVVHVVEDRDLSGTIEQRMGVRHESPQIIVIEGERSIWHASHWRIDLEELEEVLRTGLTPSETH